MNGSREIPIRGVKVTRTLISSVREPAVSPPRTSQGPASLPPLPGGGRQHGAACSFCLHTARVQHRERQACDGFQPQERWSSPGPDACVWLHLDLGRCDEEEVRPENGRRPYTQGPAPPREEGNLDTESRTREECRTAGTEMAVIGPQAKGRRGLSAAAAQNRLVLRAFQKEPTTPTPSSQASGCRAVTTKFC